MERKRKLERVPSSLEQREEETSIFSLTLFTSWYGLRRRKWPFQIVASANPSGLIKKKKKSSRLWRRCVGPLCFSCWQKCVEIRICPHGAAESRQWTELSSSRRRCSRSDVRSEHPVIDVASGCDISTIISSIISKDRVFTWWIGAAVWRPGPPRWNWNVNVIELL